MFSKSLLLKNLPKITQQKKIWHLCAQHKENWQWNSHKRMSVSKETQICPQLERSSESTAWKVIFPFWPKAMEKSGLYLIAMGIALFYPQQVYSASETAKNTFRCKLMTLRLHSSEQDTAFYWEMYRPWNVLLQLLSIKRMQVNLGESQLLHQSMKTGIK